MSSPTMQWLSGILEITARTVRPADLAMEQVLAIRNT